VTSEDHSTNFHSIGKKMLKSIDNLFSKSISQSPKMAMKNLKGHKNYMVHSNEYDSNASDNEASENKRMFKNEKEGEEDGEDDDGEGDQDDDDDEEGEGEGEGDDDDDDDDVEDEEDDDEFNNGQDGAISDEELLTKSKTANK
jgi:hypothetical protein